MKRMVLLGLPHPQFEYVEAIVHLEVFAYVARVDGIEVGLRLPQGSMEFAHLHHVFWMIGREAYRLPTLHNVLSQSQGKGDHTLLSFLVANGIVVDRADDT